MLRSFLALFVVALFGVSGIGHDGNSEAVRYCGDDYYFRLSPPRGWVDQVGYEGSGVEIVLAPSGKGFGIEGLEISVGLRRMASDDLDFQISRAAAELTMRKAPKAIRDGTIQHPRLPSRSAILDFEDLQVYYVMMDAQSGRGYVVAAVLSRAAEKLSPGDLDTFETLVASLHYDAQRVCEEGPDDTTVERVVSPPAARAPYVETTSPKSTKGRRAMLRALLGCDLLSRLFVPVQCMPGRLAGSPAVLAEFDRDDSRSAEKLLETFRDRVAVTYCWAARSHALPRLAFGTREKKPASGKAAPIREYSCETGGLTTSYPADQFDYDRAVYEDL